MSQFAQAILLTPDFAAALNELAWILATDPRPEFRNGPQAVGLAGQACDLTGQQNPAMLLTLAAAYAEAGRFAEALATVGKADELAKAQGQKGIEAQAGSLRAAFEAGHPFHGHAK
jgi:hypothetical protein